MEGVYERLVQSDVLVQREVNVDLRDHFDGLSVAHHGLIDPLADGVAGGLLQL